MTAVINLRGRRDNPDFDPDLNPNVVYLGCRQWWGTGRLLEGHPLGNPWARQMKRLGRDEALRRYSEWLPTVPGLDAILESLRGKTLACWCQPNPCHCDLVAALIAERWPS